MHSDPFPLPRLPSGRTLAWAGVGLLALVWADIALTGQALAWVAADLEQRHLALYAIFGLNGATVLILLAGLLVAALRCDLMNDLRFLSMLAGSAMGLMILLGTAEQRFDVQGYRALRVLEQSRGIRDSPVRHQALVAIQARDMNTIVRVADSIHGAELNQVLTGLEKAGLVAQSHAIRQTGFLPHAELEALLKQRKADLSRVSVR